MSSLGNYAGQNSVDTGNLFTLVIKLDNVLEVECLPWNQCR